MRGIERLRHIKGYEDEHQKNRIKQIKMHLMLEGLDDGMGKVVHGEIMRRMEKSLSLIIDAVVSTNREKLIPAIEIEAMRYQTMHNLLMDLSNVVKEGEEATLNLN